MKRAAGLSLEWWNPRAEVRSKESRDPQREIYTKNSFRFTDANAAPRELLAKTIIGPAAVNVNQDGMISAGDVLTADDNDAALNSKSR